MNLKTLCLSIALCLLHLIGNAQQKPYNLKVGEQVPAIQINKIINDTQKSFNTTDFKDQLLIIDFWNTRCSACIEGLPKMHQLQTKFGNRIKILPVAFEAETTITAFMQRNKLVKNLKIPSVVEDKTLSEWFKHAGWPHEVWIYKNKVIAITGAQYVDERTIQSVLDGKELQLPVKDDFYVYDYKQPFLTADHNALSYVAVTGYREGAKRSVKLQRDNINGGYRTWFINMPVLRAYDILWRSLVKVNPIYSAETNKVGINPNQIILEVKNKDKYLYDAEKDYLESWHRKYGISYEWFSKDTLSNPKELNQTIIKDLDRLLGLKGRWEKRKTTCLILRRTSTADKIKSSGKETVFAEKTPIKKLHNQGLSSLVFYINGLKGIPPVFDETNYKSPVDLDLNIGSWTDIPALRKALQIYDLDLKEETRELDMFILTEVK